MKIGLFFGSFNPIHNGHIAIIKDLLRNKIVDKIYLIPSKQNPWKEKYKVSYEDRCHMCELATIDIDNVTVSFVENTIKEPPYYTYKSLKLFKKYFPNDTFFIIGGSDVINNIKNWEQGEWILNHFQTIEINRNSSEGLKIFEAFNISSTLVRNNIKNGINVNNLISKKVNKYIMEKSFYKEKNWSYTIKDSNHPHHGETLWSGRYCAIAAIIFTEYNGYWYVLANKRGKGTPDFQGLWNCPCGFLENNETAEQGCSRETLEETGVKIDPKEFKLFGVETDPATCNKGHVTLRYWAKVNIIPENYSIENLKGGEENEVEDIKWICLNDIFEPKTNDYSDWAFNHKDLILKVFNNKIK